MNLKPALKIISLLFFILGLMIISSQLAAAVSCANVPISGNYTVDTACNFANTVDGVDAGTGTANTAILTSTNGGSLTVGAGTTLAVGSMSLTGGNIIIIDTGLIKVGTALYATDADADGYPASITAFYTSAASGRVRRNSLASLVVDCDDANAAFYPGTCSGNTACTTAGATQACATAGTCQTGGGCSVGSCVAVTNQTSAQDLYNQCTASYNACSGNYRIGPDGYCNGAGACKTTGLSDLCATAGTCQTGGGCSGGSCIAVNNVGFGGQGTNCTASNQMCNGSGGCLTLTCEGAASGHDGNWKCALTGKSCYVAYNPSYECIGTTVSCSEPFYSVKCY